ncbi:Glutamyl-tRNA(Gln) amidotransferase subunit A, mitochondrial [Dirofilaria immitis]|nr:Glutamyl-tRNA(Gln) amidotransferase subunit A, mitochondrial [Dirofilaria immitis]
MSFAWERQVQKVIWACKNGLSNEANLETDWRSPGGSSGGCGVAVQLGISSVSLGSDTGGSSRNPAAFTGLLASNLPMGSYRDMRQICGVNVKFFSVLCRSAEVMNGRDIFDSTCIDAPSSCFMQGNQLEYYNETLSTECWKGWNDAAKALALLGCKIKEVSMPSTTYSIICYHVLAEADIISNMARYDGVKYGHRSYFDKSTFTLYSATRSESFNEIPLRRIFRASPSCATIDQNGFRPRLPRGRIDKWHTTAFSEISDTDGYKRECEDDFYTQPCNMAGVPAISVPFTRTADGFPIGVQIVADYLKDGIALDVAEKLYQYSNA